jgi:hypothetical protein
MVRVSLLQAWKAALVFATAAMAAANAAGPPLANIRADSLSARVDTALVRRSLGADAFAVIDNVVNHEGLPPPAAPPLVREILARPLDAVDAEKLFDRAVPAGLRRVAATPPVTGARPTATAAERLPAELADLLAAYCRELEEARNALRQAGGSMDEQAVVRTLSKGGIPSAALRSLAVTGDLAALDRASAMFVDATARLVAAVGKRAGSLRFPEKMLQIDSAVGIVSIGTWGDDHHGPGAAVIIDPGGDDVYERAPVTGGAVSVIVDFAGNDSYRGSDLVVNGLSAIVDFSGNDRYAMSGPGLGAVIFGVSLLIDLAGHDSYEATLFGQGAAAFGVGAILDLRGNDNYRLRAVGQGFGMAHGLGLLWDRDGDDTYVAGGVRDAFDRGGGVSMAQGAARGARTSLGGGVGMLRDDEGNDVYEAEMFAQGMGFYYGVGLLWDGAGNDRYRAVRYAQGNGVHEAVGILRDDAGNDHYQLTFGVGQGMGLDLAVGVLSDAAGDDRYESQVLAQGTATANGVGILVDGGGSNEWRMGADRRSWGHAQWSRGLPSLGLLFHEPDGAAFVREGTMTAPPLSSAEFGGPLGSTPISHEAVEKPVCPDAAAATPDDSLPLPQALSAIAPGFAGGTVDPAIHASVRRRLIGDPQASLAELPHEDFVVVWSLTGALRCALADATGGEANVMWAAFEAILKADASSPFAGPIAAALQARPPAPAQMLRILGALDAHPGCGVRAAALFLRHAAAGQKRAPAVVEPARAALRSSCWRLQAAGLRVLKDLDISPEAGSRLASFLRDDAGAPGAGEREGMNP